MLIKRERDEDEEEKKVNIIIKINMQQLKKRKPPVQWKAYCSSIFILNLQTNMNQNNSLFSKKNNNKNNLSNPPYCSVEVTYI